MGTYDHFIKTLSKMENPFQMVEQMTAKFEAAIVNPKEMLDKGYVRPMEGHPAIIIDKDDEECALQQNGIDLRLDEVSFVEDGITRFTVGKKNDSRCNYRSLEPNEDNEFMLLPGRQYALDFMEWVEVPKGTAAYLFVRSSVNRYSGVYMTGLWDSGFKGRLGGIHRPSVTTFMERGVRVAQVVFVKADSHRPYEGQYQDQKKQV